MVHACGSSESFTQADVLGSYLYVDEINMAAESRNQVHLACRHSNSKTLAAVAVQVEVSKAGAPPSYSNTLGLLLGSPDGTFVAQITYETGE